MRLFILAVLVLQLGCVKYEVGDCLTDGYSEAHIIEVTDSTYRVVVSNGAIDIDVVFPHEELERRAEEEHLFRCDLDKCVVIMKGEE